MQATPKQELKQQQQPEQISTTKPFFTFTHNPVEVELVDKLGTDLTVVNSARISFGKQHSEVTPADKKLMNYLAREKHFSPFRHCMLQFRIRVPEFVARQAYKHVVGIEATSVHPTKDHAWNEVSGRYKPYDTIYVPPTWHTQDANAKQCSGAEMTGEEAQQTSELYHTAISSCIKSYEEMLKNNVAKEQARMLLPLTIMTEYVWTASLQAVFNFIQLRNAPHAQKEIQQLAREIERLTAEAFPQAYSALSQSSS